MNPLPGSKKAQKELSDRRKEKTDQQSRDLKFLMSQPQGRRFMFDLIDRRCLLFSASYTGNSETYLREGKRAVAIELTGDLQKLCPNEYVQMIGEAFDYKRRDALVEEIAMEVARKDEDV